jgi:hypothetical protein
VVCKVSEGQVSVRPGERKGSFIPERRSVHLELRGVNARPKNVSANGEEAVWSYEASEKTLMVRLAEEAGETVVEVSP